MNGSIDWTLSTPTKSLSLLSKLKVEREEREETPQSLLKELSRTSITRTSTHGISTTRDNGTLDRTTRNTLDTPIRLVTAMDSNAMDLLDLVSIRVLLILLLL